MRHLILIFLAVLFSANAAHSQANQPLDLPVCQVARAQPVYSSEAIEIIVEVKKLIRTYKKSWVNLCDRKAGSSVYEAFALAKTLEEEFFYLDGTMKGTDMEKAIEIDRVLGYDLIQFIPAFEGSYMEYEYFMPRLAVFNQVSKYGTDEDKLFFQLHTDLNGDGTLPNWYQKTWHYGGCLRFGEYDWVGAFQRLSKAKDIKGIQYLKIIDKIESNLQKTLEKLYYKYRDGKFKKICTCKATKAVQIDLEKLFKHLGKIKRYTKLAAKLKATLVSLKKKEIPILSEAEEHCSGG